MRILFQDEHMVVVDKPRDLVVHPAAGHPSGTLVNALLHHVPDFERGYDDVRPGIVHRLDRDTTGVMVVAKHRRAQAQLSDAFRLRHVEKSYLAVIHGCPHRKLSTIDTSFGRHPTDRKRFSSKVLEGKRAVTHYKVEQIYPGASRVRVDLETGRTHQIRVHFADLGHPLVGDSTYGRRRKCRDPRSGPLINGFARPALHALRLSVPHPVSGETMTFDAPVPEDLQALLDALTTIAATGDMT